MMSSQMLWPLMHRMSQAKALVEEWILGVSGLDGRESVCNDFESYLKPNLQTFNKGLVWWSLVLQTFQSHFIPWRSRNGPHG